MASRAVRMGDARSDRETTPKNIVVFGVSYRSAQIDMRERFSVFGERTAEVLRDILAEKSGLGEAVLLSTCNRVEAVGSVVSGDESAAREWLSGVFSSISGMAQREFRDNVYFFSGEPAVRHIFRVCAGLDSMVLGEPQVFGQVKEAYRHAQECGAVKATLGRLFERAFTAAKLVRTETAIGRLPVSICYAARDLARQIFGELNGLSLLVFGSGDTAQLAVRHFLSAGVRDVFLVSRSGRRAEQCACSFGIYPAAYADVPKVISRADIIIGATVPGEDGSFVLRSSSVLASSVRSRERPRLFIDLGVPRNFDPAIGLCPEVFLYNIDDLDEVIRVSQDARQQESSRAEAIIEEEVEKFFSWVRHRSTDRLIQEFIRREERFRKEETLRTLRRLRKEGFDERQCMRLGPVLEDFAHALLAKVFHRSFSQLKQGEEAVLRQVFRRLFLDEDKGD